MFENFDWIAAMRQSPVMIVILGLSVVTFGLAIERALYYWKRRGNPLGVIGQALVFGKSGVYGTNPAGNGVLGVSQNGNGVAG